MTMLEARRADRVRTFLRARIIFNNHNSTIDCIIRNYSEMGAKIEISNSTTIPGEFTLEIPARSQIQRAKIVWRAADAIGVEFLGQAGADAKLLDKVERLELEIRRLKTTNAILTKRLEDLGQDVSINVS